MASHYEESMQRDIERIRGKVASMAALVEQALTAVLRAFVTRNRQLAYTVILRDRRVDELEKEIDRLCLEFFVRQQPAAKHLRFAYTAIKINQELERIGDYAESIARQVLKLSNVGGGVPVGRFEEIAQRSIPMLHAAVQSFLDEDPDLALRTIPVEDEVDGLKSSINAELFKLQQNGAIPPKALTPLMTVARRFERVSDQAQNICEDVVYMITGEYTKHLGGDVWRMVFVDDNNCASQMAEAIGNSLNQPQFVFSGAGLASDGIDPAMSEFLRRKGLDISRAIPRLVEHVPNVEFAQILVALTPEARHAFPLARKAVRLDWAEEVGPCPVDSAADQEAAFEATYRVLHQNISDVCQAVLADHIQ
jgi:phosphate transport system protein